MVKVAIVSQLYPRSHYTIFLGKALRRLKVDRVRTLFYRSRSENIRLDLENMREVWSKNPFYPFQIFRQVVRDKPSIVHIQHEFNMFGGPSTALVFPLLLLLLKISRTKTIVTLHAVVSPSIVNREFASTFGAPALLWPVLRIMISLLYRTTVSLSTFVIVHSKNMKIALETSYAARADKVRVIPIGVPEPTKRLFTNQKWRNLLKGKNVVLFFGYLTERKGVEYLIQAFHDLAGSYGAWVLLVVGGKLKYSTPYIKKLSSLVTDLGINDRVIMTTTTPFPTDELDEIFELADFVVLPYTMAISSSIVLSFAMQHGKPVIVPDNEIMREFVDEGEDGLLCKPKDVESLRDAMRVMMEDPLLRKKLSNSMTQKASTFSWNQPVHSISMLTTR